MGKTKGSKKHKASVSRVEALRAFVYKVGQEPVGMSLAEAYPGYSETFELEQFLYSLPENQVRLFVCLAFDMPTSDIVKALNLRNRTQLYSLRAHMKKRYRELNKEW